MNKIRLGFALCGSFCTFDEVIPQVESLCMSGYDVTPIMSHAAYTIDTRFGKAEHFIWRLEEICGKKVLHTLQDVEPIGPKGLLDIIVVAPCTGNTLAKLALGISDTPVTMACKSHLRNERPVVIGISTNDALSGNAENIGRLLNRKHVYFVPFGQDDPYNKHRSMIADMSLIKDTVEHALQGKQLQPILLRR